MAWARNMDSISVGGNNRSQSSGNSDSTVSTNSEPVTRLEKVNEPLLQAWRWNRLCCTSGAACVRFRQAVLFGWWLAVWRLPSYHPGQRFLFMRIRWISASKCHSKHTPNDRDEIEAPSTGARPYTGPISTLP